MSSPTVSSSETLTFLELWMTGILTVRITEWSLPTDNYTEEGEDHITSALQLLQYHFISLCSKGVQTSLASLLRASLISIENQ